MLFTQIAAHLVKLGHSHRHGGLRVGVLAFHLSFILTVRAFRILCLVDLRLFVEIIPVELLLLLAAVVIVIVVVVITSLVLIMIPVLLVLVVVASLLPSLLLAILDIILGVVLLLLSLQ